MKTKTSITIITITALLVIWIIFFWYLWEFGEYVRGNPIAAGAKRFGVDCTCTSDKLPGAMMFVTKEGNVSYYYPDPEKAKPLIVNTSNWDKLIPKE